MREKGLGGEGKGEGVYALHTGKQQGRKVRLRVRVRAEKSTT